MFKKSLISFALALALACSALAGCSASPDSPAESSSSAASSAGTSSAASSSSSADVHTIQVTVQIDAKAISDLRESEALRPYENPESYTLNSQDATAYDALTATGAKVEGSPSFVTAIDGVGENLAGSGSGWMYKVNGETPPVAANECKLKEGDAVVWYYGSLG